jgi:glycine/D-amino acid oxidase-like deaminating enzyme
VGQTEEVLARCGVPFETLSQAELRVRYPQMCFESVARGVFEPESGALLARRAVQALIDDAPQIEYRHEAVAPLRERDVRTISGDPIKAGIYIFACGAWLPKLFPGLLSGRIFPTRQEVFFFGTPPGDTRYSPPAMPCWIEPGDLYGIPDLEARGFKIACDHHGEPIDPETQERLVTTLNVMRARMASLFPGLKDAPLVESRVCQYENTSSGHFLIDRHPDFNDIWLVGGGSGHGFKHGPAVGEYVASQINGLVSKQTRFQFDTKTTTPNRIVY